MRSTLGFVLTLVLVLGLVAAGGGRAAAWSSGIWVNDDKPANAMFGSSCNFPNYNTIQQAVNAAGAGDRINVCRGNYPEQVVFSGSSKNNIQLRSVDVWAAVIKAPPTQLDPNGIPDPTNNAIVKVSGSANVTILAFTITGPRPLTWATGPFPLDQFSGVRVDSNGSANILGNHIIDIRDDPLSGAQHGVGIQVGRAAEFTNGSAKIIGNVIERYQKNGMTISNSMSSGEVAYNRVLGIGPTILIAQNGIQISSGATARIRQNFVYGHIYTPQTFASAGMILFDPGVVLVDHNTVTSNDVGIWNIQTDSGSVNTGNYVRASTYDGIDIDTATGNRLSGNKVERNNPGIGLYDASANTISDNRVDRNAGDFGSGILLAFASNDNLVKDNKVTNNGQESGDTTDGIRIEDPATGNLIRNNHLKHNLTHDCHDWDAASGNTWTDNEAGTSSPPDICGEDEDADKDDGEHHGWDRDHNWNAEYSVPADVDFTAAYSSVDVDGLLQLLPQLQVNTGHHLSSPSN